MPKSYGAVNNEHRLRPAGLGQPAIGSILPTVFWGQLHYRSAKESELA